jgi:hypothetical protein
MMVALPSTLLVLSSVARAAALAVSPPAVLLMLLSAVRAVGPGRPATLASAPATDRARPVLAHLLRQIRPGDFGM